MKYYNSDGIYIFPISINSLSKEGFKEMCIEAEILKENNVIPRNKRKNLAARSRLSRRKQKTVVATAEDYWAAGLKYRMRNNDIADLDKNFPDSSIVNTFVENKNADNRLYYFNFYFKEKKYYKLGITSRTLRERYGSEYEKINKIFYDKKIDSALKIEKELKRKFKNDIFPLNYFNNGSGHTEIFDRDILELDS